MNEQNASRRAELQFALDRLPRVGLATLPTPFEHCPRLSEALGGPQIWIKRDDLTGLATGGNKTRMLEFVLGKALEEGADTVVGGAAVQSNYCRQLAAACARLGLECHLVLRKVRGERDREVQGSLLLDLLVGAHVDLVKDEGSWENLGVRIRAKGEELTAAGRKVLRRPRRRRGRDPHRRDMALFLRLDAGGNRPCPEAPRVADPRGRPAGPAGTGDLGLDLRGVPLLGGDRVRGVARHLDRGRDADIVSMTDYIGPGYAVLTDAAREVMLMAGRLEGLLLDPVYTAKAMSGLIDHVRQGKVAGEAVVFLHTGGLPALFAYADSLGLEELLNSG